MHTNIYTVYNTVYPENIISTVPLAYPKININWQILTYGILLQK